MIKRLINLLKQLSDNELLSLITYVKRQFAVDEVNMKEEQCRKEVRELSDKFNNSFAGRKFRQQTFQRGMKFNSADDEIKPHISGFEVEE